jgi:hypothetical protein
MTRNKLKLQVKWSKGLTEFFIVFWFLFCWGVAYFIIDIANDKLEGNYRLLFLPLVIIQIVVWLVLTLLSSRLTNKKLGLICPHCDKVCYGHWKDQKDVNEETFLLTGRCNYCQEMMFDFSDGEKE